MEFTTFVRKPFAIQAVEITKENIEELAPYIGTLKHKDNGDPFIAVNKDLVPNVDKVYCGYWMTKMDDNIRCYSKRVFRKQFTEATPDIKAWMDSLNGSYETAGVGG